MIKEIPELREKPANVLAVIDCALQAFAKGGNTMDLEIRQILNMLADGRISVEETELLLAAIGVSPGKKGDLPGQVVRRPVAAPGPPVFGGSDANNLAVRIDMCNLFPYV
ncbi:MAG: hypothetical protein JSV44_12340 [Candidatus Zixiibacteriota bacterium]|nr:MAG: hypothetical protein JSV44_12340 [candidate division Zixibacteria bacterium]